MNSINSEDIKTILFKIQAKLDSIEEFWRTNPDDSSNINLAVYVSLREVSNAIKEALKDDQNQN